MSCEILALACALVGAGCARGSFLGITTSTTPITVQSGKPVPAKRIYQAGLIASSPGHTAKVSFLRDKGLPLSAVTFKIAVDGKPAFAMRAGEFQTLYLVPGVHTFTLEMNNSVFTGTATTAELQNGAAVSHTFSLGYATTLADGDAEAYRISSDARDLGPRVEIVDAMNGASRGFWSGLYGRIVNGRYSAPGEKVAFRAPKGRAGGFVNILRDNYNVDLDRGYVVHFNEVELQAVHYAGLAGLGIASPSDSNEYRAALNEAWANFAMPFILTAASPKAEVVHQERVVDQGKDMLLSIVRLPDVSESLKATDGFPAVLMLIEGGYAVVLRSQSAGEDEARKNPKHRASDCLPGLLVRKSALEFQQ